MLSLLEDLPVELVGTNVFGYLSLKDIVMLERACGSKKSHQAFMEQIPHSPSVELSYKNHKNVSALSWCTKRQCKLRFLTISLPDDNPALHVKKLQLDYLDLDINSTITIESLNPLLESKKGCKISSITVKGIQNREVMEQLSACTGNVKQLTIRYSKNCMDWLTADILSRWKLNEINLIGITGATPLVSVIIQTCIELTRIKLYSYNIDDAAVIAIAQHCPKLETLLLRSSNITWTFLLALSERGLPLEELDIVSIPNIPTVDIARCCSHALSCIRYFSTSNFHQNGQDATILIPYMAGLNSLFLQKYCDSYIPLLTQHCHKLTKIAVYNSNYSVTDILSLCHANPLLSKVAINASIYFTETALIELIHACPHLHTLDLSYETDITDTSILALSEHCHQLQWLDVSNCTKVTEAAVLQLLQRCYKLTRLYISSGSLSEETWTQFDKNTQKRVRRW